MGVAPVLVLLTGVVLRWFEFRWDEREPLDAWHAGEVLLVLASVLLAADGVWLWSSQLRERAVPWETAVLFVGGAYLPLSLLCWRLLHALGNYRLRKWAQAPAWLLLLFPGTLLASQSERVGRKLLELSDRLGATMLRAWPALALLFVVLVAETLLRTPVQRGPEE